MIYTQYESPMGPLTLSSDGTALTGLSFGPCSEPSTALPLFDEACAWLDAYFIGKDPGSTPPLAPAGTAFQRKVWQALLTVPFGVTAAYGEIARTVGCRKNVNILHGMSRFRKLLLYHRQQNLRVRPLGI